MDQGSYCLGIEFGSTRIKAVCIDQNNHVCSTGSYTWKSNFCNGIWTYDLAEAWIGLREALQNISSSENIAGVGISGMMHGYLAFDEKWNLLTPFRTWQNTMTAEAASALTELFQFNIPQRWSIAHLYQAILNNEDHIDKIAHITTLAGYVHYMLTGVNAVGIGEASGMFPIDSESGDYDKIMLRKFEELPLVRQRAWKIQDLLPRVLQAGESAGVLTEEGSALVNGKLLPGTPFAPPEGDAGTGMTATNAVAPRTGNVSAGTSIFAMVVLENKLKHVYEEIDLVTTPSGKPVAMVHCNNCTNDSNAWTSVLKETVSLFADSVDDGEIYTKLYNKALEADADCGGVLVCNYLAGEGITHLDMGRPMVIRKPESRFTLANFFRAQLYSTMATLKIGMDILADEHVPIESITGHGGLFKTPIVGQRFLAAALNTPVTCMKTAGEGGPYGMALLVRYMIEHVAGESLESYLQTHVFGDVEKTEFCPILDDVIGFGCYMNDFKKLLNVEKLATEVM